MTETLYALLAIAMVLTIVSLLVPLAERLRLPHTVLLAIAGMGLGFFGSWVQAQGHAFGHVVDVFMGLERLEGATDIFLPLFLPPLLFTAGLTIDVRRLFDEVFAVLLLAIVAVLVCIAFVAGALHYATGIDFMVCLLLGAVVSTTDPAAVIGIFRDVGAPKRLSILAEGESLFNDAVAIAAFGFCVEFLLHQSGDPDVARAAVAETANPVIAFVREFLGGIVFGFSLTRVTMLVLPRLSDSDAAIASVTVSLAYTSYIVGDEYLHISGVVTVVVAALTIAAYGPTHLHPKRWTALRQIWTQLDFWSNCLIFVLASMLAASVLLQITWLYVGGLLAMALAAFVARVAVVFGMLPILERTGLVQPVDHRYKAVLAWGGLRGAVTIVLAMVAASNGQLSSDIREFAAVLATLFVLFTLFVNATTLGVMMRLLGLDKLSRLELALRDRVLALAKINVTHHLQQIIREHNVRVEGLDVDPLSAGDETVAEAPAELALHPDERMMVGLLTLCTQERELYLEQFEQQTLSRRMVARLTARADRLIDAVRDRGAEGYQQAVRSFAFPDSAFGLALWLQRRFSIDWLLTERLADRFEALMVQQDVLAELALFNVQSISDLLGEDTEKRLAEVIADRQQLVASALHALVLQYPGYAESIRDRQLERAAIRFESAEYSRRLRESIIGREVYLDLRGRLNKRREAIADRPPLDLGLELRTMIARVPLFTGLDQKALTALGHRLSAVLVLPHQKIVAIGSQPDAMYFIAAGEVTVIRDGVRLGTLREGDFFGEMGLLDRKPRNADVISEGYSHLLALSRRDFNRLLDARPELRATIEQVAAQRIATPTSTAASD